MFFVLFIFSMFQGRNLLVCFIDGYREKSLEVCVCVCMHVQACVCVHACVRVCIREMMVTRNKKRIGFRSFTIK